MTQSNTTVQPNNDQLKNVQSTNNEKLVDDNEKMKKEEVKKGKK